MKTTKRCTVLAALVLAATSGLLFAGPLDPPPGPVASTHKTLSEVEPRIAINATNTPGDATTTFRITQPGSYYLTGNMTGEVGKAGISIDTSHVTIDLCGYVMDGATVPGVSGSRDGIVGGTISNIRVTNGVIKSWGRRGIQLNIASNSMYDHLRFSGNGANLPTQALYVGKSSIITDCVFENNIGNALQTDSSCVITRCSINGLTGSGIPTAAGITTGSGCLISESTVAGCASIGIDAGAQSLVERCVITNCAGIGINASTGTEIRGNTITGISATGSSGAIQVNSFCMVRDNVCRSGGYGIRTVGAGNTIVGNHFSGHTNVYVLTVNNRIGPFVNASNTGASTGSANLAGTMGSADPNANFIE